MQMLPFTKPTLGEAEQQAVQSVLASGWITTGPKVIEFEQALARYIGGEVTVRVFSSATIALEAILIASGIGPGDEVIVPAMSFVATANVVVRVGAKPVFVDVELVSRNIDTRLLAAAITTQTKAIMPVHFAGRAVDLNAVYELANKHHLLVIEDAAQAIGTQYNGKKIGASGNPVCFSFHPNKNMTSIEGGAVATTDQKLITRLEQLRFHGIDKNPDGTIEVKQWGGKMNLPDVNAAIGIEQLNKLDGFNHTRHELALQYIKRLEDQKHIVIAADVAGHSWHMFAVCIDFDALGTTRADFQQQLLAKEIGTGIHYQDMPGFQLYQQYGNKPGDFPVAEQIGHQTLTLPLFPLMTADDVDHVCNEIIGLIKGLSK